MNRVSPHELTTFLRRYRFPGGRVRGVRVAHTADRGVVVEFRLAVNEAIRDLGTAARRVRLTLRLVGAEEFRVQMRPNQPKVRIADARVSYLNNLFWVNLDAWALEPGEQPKAHDFRASELFAAGRELYWDEAPPPEPKAE